MHRVRQRLGLVLAGQPDLGVRTAAVVERDDPAVVVGVAVGAHAERLGERAGDAQQEAAGRQGSGADWASADVRAAVAVVPALGGQVAALQRQGADPAEAEVRATSRTWAFSSASSGSSPKEYVGTSRGSSSATGSRSPGDRSPGLMPLAVGHPLGRDDGLVAGDQHDLVDGHGLLPGRPGHGDRPAPAEVAGSGAGEEVGDQPVALDHVAEVLADVGGVHVLEQRGTGRSTAATATASGLARTDVITGPSSPIGAARSSYRDARGSHAALGSARRGRIGT